MVCENGAYLISWKIKMHLGIEYLARKAPLIFGQILGTFFRILGIFWVIFEPTGGHKRQL
ncbi:hypothetical protein D7226_01020 [Legionella pneumophila]|nr:hypothetical protein D7226_01020 [Legionella pneumophila]